MLKFYKNLFSNYQNANIIQSISLILFVLFFISVVVFVMSRSKKHYENQERLPLED
jgi:cytochrome c oxidase cbb3-type subunit 4